MFPMISADRTTSELLFYRCYLTLTSLCFLGSEVRSYVVSYLLFQTVKKLPKPSKIFLGVATVTQDVFVPIGVPEQ